MLLQYVTGPSDFINLPVTNVTFSPSNESLTVSVTILDDDMLEGREQFVVLFSIGGGQERVDVPGPDNATVTILDNDSE